jgi:hypothetical protein
VTRKKQMLIYLLAAYEWVQQWLLREKDPELHWLTFMLGTWRLLGWAGIALTGEGNEARETEFIVREDRSNVWQCSTLRGPREITVGRKDSWWQLCPDLAILKQAGIHGDPQRHEETWMQVQDCFTPSDLGLKVLCNFTGMCILIHFRYLIVNGPF